MSSLMKFQYESDILQFEAGGDYPAKRKIKLYQVKDRSAGGKLHVENLGIATRTRIIKFSLMPKNDYINLINWVMNIVIGGMHNFEFTDEYGDVGTVKLMNDEIDFDETSLEKYSGSITLEYV